MSLYEFVNSSPITHFDPEGMAKLTNHEKHANECTICLSAKITFSPDPPKWTVTRIPSPNTPVFHVGWVMIATFTYRGDIDAIDFIYHEAGSLKPANMVGAYANAKRAKFFPLDAANGTDNPLRPGFELSAPKGDRMNHNALDDTLHTVSYTDNAGTSFKFVGPGSFTLGLTNYSVQASCQGPDNPDPVESRKYKISGSVDVTLNPNTGVAGNLPDLKPNP